MDAGKVHLMLIAPRPLLLWPLGAGLRETTLTLFFLCCAGLIFVGYCVVCYLVTALLFSLLILDLAALVVTVSPTKAIFKYTDLVYVGEWSGLRGCSTKGSRRFWTLFSFVCVAMV